MFTLVIKPPKHWKKANIVCILRPDIACVTNDHLLSNQSVFSCKLVFELFHNKHISSRVLCSEAAVSTSSCLCHCCHQLQDFHRISRCLICHAPFGCWSCCSWRPLWKVLSLVLETSFTRSQTGPDKNPPILQWHISSETVFNLPTESYTTWGSFQTSMSDLKALLLLKQTTTF